MELLIGLIMLGGGLGAPQAQLGDLRINPWNHTLSYEVYEGKTDSKGKFKRTKTRKCSLDFHPGDDFTKAQMTCDGKALPFTQAEAESVHSFITAMLQYAVESTLWFDAGGEKEKPTREPVIAMDTRLRR